MRVLAVMLVLNVVAVSSCVRCPSPQVQQGDECVMPCNSTQDCARSEICVEGYCKAGSTAIPDGGMLVSSSSAIVSSSSAESSSTESSSSIADSSSLALSSSSIASSLASSSRASSSSLDGGVSSGSSSPSSSSSSSARDGGFSSSSSSSSRSGSGSSAGGSSGATSGPSSSSSSGLVCRWSSPSNLGELNSLAPEMSPEFSSDGRTLYFASMRTGNAELYMATRVPPLWTFSAPVPISELNTPLFEADPSVTSEGGRIFFTRAQPDGGLDIFTATRSPDGGPFENVAPYTAINSDGDEQDPFVTSTGMNILFAAERDGGVGGYDIWNFNVSTATMSPFTVANSTGDDVNPSVTADRDAVYFNSNRDGDDDLYVVERGDAGMFGPARAITELNTPQSDISPAITPDGLAMVFVSSRPGGVGGGDLWVSVWICQ